MRSKNAWVILPVLLVLFLILSIPWIAGYRYKQHFLSLIDQQNELYAAQLHILVRSYKLGWLHSTAQLEITAYRATQQPFVIIQDEERITHGPLLHDPIQKRVTFALAAAKSNARIMLQHTAIPQGQPILYTANHVMYFNSTIESAFNIAKINTPTVRWDGLTGNSLINLNQDEIENSLIAIQLGSLAITAPVSQNSPITFTSAPANIKCQLGSANDIPTGQCKSTFPLLTFLLPNKAMVSMNAVQIKHNSFVKNNFYSTLYEITINNIAAPQFIIPNFSAIKLQSSLNNINTAAISPGGPAAVLQNRHEVDGKLIDPGSSYTTLLTFSSTYGNFDLHGSARWKARTNQATVKIQELPHYLYAEANLQISMALAKKLAGYIVPYSPDYIEKLKRNAAENQIIHLSQTTAKERFDKAVAELVQKHQLDLPSAIAIMNTHENHPSEDAMKAAINALPTTPEGKASLISATQENKAMLSAINQQSQQMSADEMATVLINDWLQHNYLLQKDNNYLAKIIFDAGNLQINGGPLQLQ